MPNLPIVNRFVQKLSATSFSDGAVKLLARRRGKSSMSGWSRRELDGAWARGDRDDGPRTRGHLPERPAMGYVTEVSHHRAERSYCIDPCSLFYQVAALAGPTPGRTGSRSLIPTLAPADADELAVYLLLGSARVDVTEAVQGRLLVLESGGDIAIAAGAEGADLLIVGGPKLDAPIVRYGPFVMNTEAELVSAINAYNAGRFGRIEPERVSA